MAKENSTDTLDQAPGSCLPSHPPRSIVHLDADAFFAAVEQASDPKLRGKAMAVGGEKRGIIASASYEARKFGVYTPMPTARARKLCPKLIVIPGDFERYEQFSHWMFGYCYDFTPDVEQTSIDEGYFDLSGTQKPPAEIAFKIKNAIHQKLKIIVSEGIGANKLVSAVASKLKKPAAFYQVPPGKEAEFLHPLPNKWLPGIGPKMSIRLNAAGLAFIHQIAFMPLELLELFLGNQAAVIRQFSHGIDNRPLVLARGVQKSFGHQETFNQDLSDEDYIEAVLRRMADDLFSKVRAEERSIRTLTVKVRYNDMAEDQVSESLSEPTDLETDIYGRLGILLRAAWKRRVSLRLVSLRLSNVYDGRFRGLLPLGVEGQKRQAYTRLAGVIDSLRQSHSHSVILRGHDFRLLQPPGDAAAPRRKRIFLPSLRLASKASSCAYVPLRVHSYYSFLDSTLSPSDIVLLAKKHRFPAVAMTDTGNLHGAAELAQAADQAGLKALFGAELKVEHHPLLLYVENAAGYSNLCRLLSLQAEKGEGSSVANQQRTPIQKRLLQEKTEGLIAISSDISLAELFPGRFYLGARTENNGGKVDERGGAMARRADCAYPSGSGKEAQQSQCPAPPPNSLPGLSVRALSGFKEPILPAVACPSVHYATPADRLGYDIVQSIRTLTLLRQEHPEKCLGGQFHFRTRDEMAERCGSHPEWLRHTLEISERCVFKFPFGKPQFPIFISPTGESSRLFLRKLVFEGAHRRYHGRTIVSDLGAAVSFAQIVAQVETELAIIAEVGYEDLFLLTHQLLQTCRAQGIEWITRGSAADSLVCYCLNISDVCPIRFGLYFKRFLNKERMALHKLPDIDIDFPHDRKDDVVDLLFARHGAAHCAVVGGFSTFQARSAVAEVAKVLGVSDHQIRRFTENFPWSFSSSWESPHHESLKGEQLLELLRNRPECRDLPLDEEPFKTAVLMAAFLDGFPRHPKMHPCGVVLSRQPMLELTPTFISNKGWPTTHFDMDSVEAVGLVKVDILAQGGLAVMRDARQSLAKRGIQMNFKELEPWEDPAIWEMISTGGARAVHHIESPAMTSLCRMSNVSEIDGLIAIVSVIRPGAANEQKKLKFTRCYQGMEQPAYPHPSLEPCLRNTYGHVVYEEHILQICEAFAELDAGKADRLRRALAKEKESEINQIKNDFFASARARQHDLAKIEEIWTLVNSFRGYAFCKAHSTAYGVEAYQAAWLKHYHPAEFMAGVLTNGKGFYHPLVYIMECHRLGLKLIPPSINEPGPAFIPRDNSIQVPLTPLKGLTARTTQALLEAHQRGRFTSINDFFHRVSPSSEEFEAMIRVGAFDEFGETRPRQFWQAQYLLKTFGATISLNQGWLIPPPGLERLPEIPLHQPTRRERLQWETDSFGFAISGHPLELFDSVDWKSYCPVNRLPEFVGQTVVTCGLIIEQRTHHQATGEVMKFLSLADWTGIIETELFAKTYRTYGLATVRYPVLEIEARIEAFDNHRGFSLQALRAGKPRELLPPA